MEVGERREWSGEDGGGEKEGRKEYRYRCNESNESRGSRVGRGWLGGYFPQ